MPHVAGPVDRDLGVVGLEAVLQAAVLRREVDPLRDHVIPLRRRLARQNLHARVRQLRHVEQGPGPRLGADRLVRRAGETRRAQGAEQVPPVIDHGEAHEAVGDEAVGHHLLGVLANMRLARGGVGGEALPAMLGVDDEEAAGEGAAIQVAPDGGDARVLGVVQHAVELVQRGVEAGAVLVHLGVAGVRQLTDADDRDAAAELHVRQVPGHVHDHAAARAAGEAEADRDQGRQGGLFDMDDKGAQRHVHGPLAGVVGVRIDRLGDGAREVPACLRHDILLRDVGLEVRVPVIAGILDLQELARAVHALEEVLLGRHRQRHGLELEAVGRDAARLQALDEGGGVVLRQPHVLVADIHHEGGEGGAGIG